LAESVTSRTPFQLLEMLESVKRCERKKEDNWILPLLANRIMSARARTAE